MATVTREREALIAQLQRRTGVCNGYDPEAGADCSEMWAETERWCDNCLLRAVAAALASVPPAAPPEDARLGVDDAHLSWRDAALRVGEELATVGPSGYYAMTQVEWRDWALERLTAVSAAPPEDARDGSVMVRVDAMYVEQMRNGGMAGPFSRIELDESGSEPRLMLTVQSEPTPESVEWWRSVAAGLGVEIRKLKDLAASREPEALPDPIHRKSVRLAARQSDPPGLADDRCAVCGWPLDPKEQMCRRGNCSMRPMPERAADPARAIAEYSAVWGGMARQTLQRWQEQLAEQIARQSDPPGLDGCINCGAKGDGGYETEEVGAFCATCWEMLRAHFRQSDPPRLAQRAKMAERSSADNT